MTGGHGTEPTRLTARIVADGMRGGEFVPADPAAVARGVWAAEPVEPVFEAVRRLLPPGLCAR